MSLPDAWNPRQYEQFKEYRARPALDLMELVEPKPAMRVIDLGCGTGELTRMLHERLAAAETLGIDRSENMLGEARKQTAPGLRFERADIATFTSHTKFDLVFSNAVFMWIPDHEALLARVTDLLTADGQLAFQIAAMNDDPVHFLAAEVAQESPFREHMNGFVHQLHVHTPEEYSRTLYRLGYSRQNVRLQVYPQVMESHESLVEWIKGSLLTAYEQRLSPEIYRRFLSRYQERLFEIVADERPLFFPYRRILAWARR